jgi:hypothetical protein
MIDAFPEDSMFKLRSVFKSWINDKITEYGSLLVQIPPTQANIVERKVFSEWEELLNRLKIKRIEHHLPYKPPKKGYIRMQDPYCIGINRKRDIEIDQDMAMKILTLGLP